jgi:hypothetical protein
MRSVNMLEFHFGYEALRDSVPAASKVLQEELAAIPHKATSMVRFVGQAHIDTAWLWPLKETVRKCAKTFSNTIALMEKYPEYIFAFSQPRRILGPKTMIREAKFPEMPPTVIKGENRNEVRPGTNVALSIEVRPKTKPARAP